jgi:catechol 2,3-dioxygenase-like lactoylglutathione lyase family enzyme
MVSSQSFLLLLRLRYHISIIFGDYPASILLAALSDETMLRHVDAAIAFYCQHLGFHEEMHPAPAFAMLTRGDLRLVLSVPNPVGGGGQSMSDGTKPEPSGWNRFAIEVSDLEAVVEKLRKAGVHFRNEIVTGIVGKQILVEDPYGNLIELFQPTLLEARL